MWDKNITQLFKKPDKEQTYKKLFSKIDDLESEKEYYKNQLEYAEKESTNTGKILKLEKENENLLETLGYMEYLLEETKKENAELKKENTELKKESKERLKKVIKLQDSKESMTYMEGMMQDALEKTTEERNIYKKVINNLCDKYNIEHREVINIVDHIQADRGTEMQR